MQNFEQKYLDQKRKYDNLIKMQTNLFNDIDQYAKSIIKIKNYILQMSGQDKIDEDEELTPETAKSYSDEIIFYLKKLGKPCECNRWKLLYKKESQQTLKLSQQKQVLLKKIKQKEEQELKDRVQINQLLFDYLQLYKKQFYEVREDKQSGKKMMKKDNQSRSKSKSKNKNVISQTQRKISKNMAIDLSPKQQNYIKMVVEKLESDLNTLHGEIYELRDQNIQWQQTLRIYRAKERQYILSSEFNY